jgi:hypothetical protein
LGARREQLDRFEITSGIGKDAWCCRRFRAVGVQKRLEKWRMAISMNFLRGQFSLPRGVFHG